MHGPLASITPPITIPAWACAMRARRRASSASTGCATGRTGRTRGSPRDQPLGQGAPGLGPARGPRPEVAPDRRPPRLPPARWRAGGSLLPDAALAETYTYPGELAGEIEEGFGGEPYIFDIPNFREQGEDLVLDRVFQMTERRFQVARRLVRTSRGTSSCWSRWARPAAPRVLAARRPGIRSTSRATRSRPRSGLLPRPGREVGALLEALPDDAVVILMSDHGARRMDGASASTSGWSARVPRVHRGHGRAHREGPDRLDQDRGLGRRRLLRAAVPERDGREPQGVVERSHYEESATS